MLYKHTFNDHLPPASVFAAHGTGNKQYINDGLNSEVRFLHVWPESDIDDYTTTIWKPPHPLSSMYKSIYSIQNQAFAKLMKLFNIY